MKEEQTIANNLSTRVHSEYDLIEERGENQTNETIEDPPPMQTPQRCLSSRSEHQTGHSRPAQRSGVTPDASACLSQPNQIYWRYTMKFIVLSLFVLLCSCQQPHQQAAQLVGANATWGNTEGPAIDSKGNLYFTSRGTYKGIVTWNEKDGFKEYLAIATKEGPGGLYFDNAGNLYVTATGEQQILKIAPDKKVTVLAENFDAMPGKSKGPNDLVVAKDGTIYFTEPNGFDGTSPKGTIYRIPKDGKPEIFSQEITGPNGIMLSADESTLYVSHNVAKDTSNIVKWKLPKGSVEIVARIEPCQADGMDIDKNGNLWLTCYSHGIAHLVNPAGQSIKTITTAQKALTNAKFGRGPNSKWLYMTSSDMDRITGYVYRAWVDIGGLQ